MITVRPAFLQEYAQTDEQNGRQHTRGVVLHQTHSRIAGRRRGAGAAAGGRTGVRLLLVGGGAGRRGGGRGRRGGGGLRGIARAALFLGGLALLLIIEIGGARDALAKVGFADIVGDGLHVIGGIGGAAIFAGAGKLEGFLHMISMTRKKEKKRKNQRNNSPCHTSCRWRHRHTSWGRCCAGRDTRQLERGSALPIASKKGREDTSVSGFDLVQIEALGQRVLRASHDGGGQEGGKQENGQHGGERSRISNGTIQIDNSNMENPIYEVKEM